MLTDAGDRSNAGHRRIRGGADEEDFRVCLSGCQFVSGLWPRVEEPTLQGIYPSSLCGCFVWSCPLLRGCHRPPTAIHLCPRQPAILDQVLTKGVYPKRALMPMTGLLGTSAGGGPFFPDPDEQGCLLGVVPRSVVVRERLLLVFGQECDGTTGPVTPP